MIYIANWKMNFSFKQSLDFSKQYFEAFSKLSHNESNKIILCPSHSSIYELQKIFLKTKISIGAQNCSAHKMGAFTGEESSSSLKDIGCEYCIIGHSERRIYHNETTKLIGKKLINLIENGISPILCIGENSTDHEQKKTISILEKQLNPILEILLSMKKKNKSINLFIAYEPIWAIGTNKIPDEKELEFVFSWLNKQIEKISKHLTCNLIYGGSVNPKNISQFKKNTSIKGFLIGGTSLVFKEFEKIIKLQ